jgi:hypothetical protein
MRKPREKKDKGVLVLLKETERDDFRDACDYYQLKYSAFFRHSALELISKFKRESNVQESTITIDKRKGEGNV